MHPKLLAEAISKVAIRYVEDRQKDILAAPDTYGKPQGVSEDEADYMANASFANDIIDHPEDFANDVLNELKQPEDERHATSYDEETQTMMGTEYVVHEILCSLADWMKDKDGDNLVVQKFFLSPVDKEYWSRKKIAKWERRLNRLLDSLHKLDSEWHTDAEYTC